MIGSLSRTSQLFLIPTIVLRVKSEHIGYHGLVISTVRTHILVITPGHQYDTLSLRFPLKQV